MTSDARSLARSEQARAALARTTARVRQPVEERFNPTPCSYCRRETWALDAVCNRRACVEAWEADRIEQWRDQA